MSVYKVENGKEELSGSFFGTENRMKLPRGSVISIPDDGSSSWVIWASEDKWEESVIGRPVFRIGVAGRLEKGVQGGLVDLLRALKEAHPSAYVLSRLPAKRIAVGIVMQASGFQVIEALLQFKLNTERVSDTKENSAVRVRRGLPSDLDRCLAFIVGRVSSRYYTDPVLGEHYERRAYRAWLSNAVAGRENILVAVEDDQAVGFCSWQEADRGTARIGLIATDEERAKSGIGSILLSACLSRCRAGGLKEIQLGTSILNLAAQRFYLKHGFQPIDHVFTYRMAW